MAVLSCLLGYGEVGLWLVKNSKGESWVKLDGNPYLRWINDYSGQHYQNAVKLGLGTLSKRLILTSFADIRLAEVIENLAVNDPPSPIRLKLWSDIFNQCTKYEKSFWDAAMNLS